LGLGRGCVHVPHYQPVGMLVKGFLLSGPIRMGRTGWTTGHSKAAQGLIRRCSLWVIRGHVRRKQALPACHRFSFICAYHCVRINRGLAWLGP
jgi:hypothetical protein